MPLEGPIVVLGGVAFFYERGHPVAPCDGRWGGRGRDGRDKGRATAASGRPGAST